MAKQLSELVLNRTWRPQLAIIGADGLTPSANAGNVLLPYTTLKLSFRWPPTLDAKKAIKKVVASVVPSIATHSTPRLFATVATIIAAAAASVAAVRDRRLLVGQIFGDGILDCHMADR